MYLMLLILLFQLSYQPSKQLSYGVGCAGLKMDAKAEPEGLGGALKN